MNSLYTEKIVYLIREAKYSLPRDYPLITAERESFDSGTYDSIIIQVPMWDFDRRTIEERTQIYFTLQALRMKISEEGVTCLIEKILSTE